jgi:thiamine biosynthesis protein ThiI
MTSSELERYVADRVLPEDGSVAVELEAPMLELGIDVRPEHAFVFAERLPGPGGLPVGTLGRTLCLISGGIDSPVAAWMTMKRGAEVAFVTFHSAPYVGEPSVRKVEDLVRVLARWQPRTRLFVAPFGPVQEAIRDAAPEGYRTVLYRRMMQRIAARLAAGTGAGALVTGESLGQVASQTLENLTCIEAAADLPVLRPLVAFDKQETIALARRIGTFELSCLPEPDCCTVFMPRRPVIRGRPEVCLEIESGYDVQGLTDAAVERVEVRDLA